jgi:hypothetical protein
VPTTFPLRRWLSSWLLMAILFTQVAGAAYACPVNQDRWAHDEDVVWMATPCAEMLAAGITLDPEQPGRV